MKEIITEDQWQIDCNLHHLSWLCNVKPMPAYQLFWA